MIIIGSSADVHAVCSAFTVVFAVRSESNERPLGTADPIASSTSHLFDPRQLDVSSVETCDAASSAIAFIAQNFRVDKFHGSEKRFRLGVVEPRNDRRWAETGE